MFWQQLASNFVLHAVIISWFIAQCTKLIVEWIRTRKLDLRLMMSAGGMPSSHSSSVTAAMLGVGLFEGFNTPLFGLAFVVTMIVLYDAAGVRRQAGIQAHKINQIINELLQGHPLSQKQLQEVLGHTPLQVFMGFLLGVVVALAVWYVKK